MPHSSDSSDEAAPAINFPRVYTLLPVPLDVLETWESENGCGTVQSFSYDATYTKAEITILMQIMC